jgi:hypothetical protein
MTIRSQFVKKNFRCRRARSETGPSHPKKPICKEEFSLPAGAVRDRPEPPQFLRHGTAGHAMALDAAKIHGEMMGKTGLGN